MYLLTVYFMDNLIKYQEFILRLKCVNIVQSGRKIIFIFNNNRLIREKFILL